ncbi:MAG: TetR/AcrR family transcriptional regulator [Fusobacterium perfoetens]|uniref:TetR/AcrR family transcriptional regulator n=1 Tax=Fusobacterium perfoetens TaxID=852 RepID=UPI0023F192F5|nr:TetR/AcrR family transcriptional regulator [Fusobacterium perfoetens]MCI6152899.1 TetR/AcrR family transcriptional regulator [Fusobacterium perfoetens]MDY3237311.1 TetR/AcrR family transcriptional regulator [Fusobacterium perfoetens]
MSRKLMFCKKQIFNKAFEIFLEEGMDKVTARNIAKIVNCSTTPIYSYYQSMEELKKELINHLVVEIKKYVDCSYTENEYVNQSIGFCKFAKEKKKIFLSVYKNKDFLKNIVMDFSKKNIEFDLKNWWIFVYGYSVLIGNSYISPDLEEIKNTLISNEKIILKKN